MAMNPHVTFDPDDNDDVFEMARLCLQMNDIITGLMESGAVEKCQLPLLRRQADDRWYKICALKKWLEERQ